MHYHVVVNDNKQIILRLDVSVKLKGEEKKKNVPLTIRFTESGAEEVALALMEAAEHIRLLRDIDIENVLLSELDTVLDTDIWYPSTISSD